MADRTREISAVDASRPNAARIYDLFLGGKSNYGPDRDLAAKVLDVFGPPPPGRLPAPQEMALRGRLFLERAVSWASRQGVRQVLDLGCGYPVSGRVITLPARGPDGKPAQAVLRATHEAAADGGPARCAYVDRDPVAVSHALALAADGTDTVAAEGDLSDPDAILADPVVQGCVNLRQPVVLLFGQVLQLWSPDAARDITKAWLEAAAPGSVIAVSTPRIDDELLWRRASEVWTPDHFWNHDRAEVASFFAGADLIDPGVVPARGWQGGWVDFAEPHSKAYVLCGVGIVG